MSLVAVQDFRYLPIMPSGCLTRKSRYGKQAVMSISVLLLHLKWHGRACRWMFWCVEWAQVAPSQALEGS